jgi:hypothetical protein
VDLDSHGPLTFLLVGDAIVGNLQANKLSMSLSNSERQRRYRKRHLGLGGRRERLSCLIAITTKRNVERLAFHFGCSITETVEKLINDKTAVVLSSLDNSGQQAFFEQRLS